MDKCFKPITKSRMKLLIHLFNEVAGEDVEWMIIFIPHFIRDVIVYPYHG